MTPLALWYDVDQAEPLIAATPAELDTAMDTVAALARPGWAPVVEITPAHDWANAPLLHAGFTDHLGVLRYAPADGTDEVYTYDPANLDSSPVVFMYADNDMEVPINAQLPAAVIRGAVHEFSRTGQRPTGVRWQHWRAPDTPGPTWSSERNS